MTDIAIKVQNLSKCYHIYDNPRDRLKQFVAPRFQRLTWQSPKQYFREFWALKDDFFEVKKGGTVGNHIGQRFFSYALFRLNTNNVRPT